MSQTPFQHEQRRCGPAEPGFRKAEKEHVQALDDTERAEAEVVAEDGEEAVEERHGPPDLRENEDDSLEDDEQPVEHCPEGTSGLVGHGAASVRTSDAR